MNNINDKKVPELLEEVIRMMFENRKRYGKHWRDVRVDRLGHCFDPFLTDEQVAQVVKLGIEQDTLRPVMKLVNGDERVDEVPAVTLADY